MRIKKLITVSGELERRVTAFLYLALYIYILGGSFLDLKIYFGKVKERAIYGEGFIKKQNIEEERVQGGKRPLFLGKFIEEGKQNQIHRRWAFLVPMFGDFCF